VNPGSDPADIVDKKRGQARKNKKRGQARKKGGSFYKNRPLDPRKNFLLNKSFWKSRNLFSKRFLAAGGISSHKQARSFIEICFHFL
jgi:hypothetical protein